MFYQFCKENDLGELAVEDVWKIETLLYGVLMTVLSDDEKISFSEFIIFLAEVIGEDRTSESPYIVDVKLVPRLLSEAVNAYQFMIDNNDSAALGPSSAQMSEYFLRYPDLKDIVLRMAPGGVIGNKVKP